MGIKTIPLRSIEEKTDNIYEAVVVMSRQAKRVLDERIVDESIKDAEEEDYGVFDEVEENGFNLNIPRYVDTFEEEEEIDLAEVQAELDRLDKELVQTRARLRQHLKELGV